jgi:hypothetical protein
LAGKRRPVEVPQGGKGNHPVHRYAPSHPATGALVAEDSGATAMYSSHHDADVIRLRRLVAELRLDLHLARLNRALKGFNPSQPRVPAGSSEGGRWTSGGGGGRPTSDARANSSSARLFANDSTNPSVIGDAQSHASSESGSGLIEPAAQQVVVAQFDRTGNPKIDGSSEKLVAILMEVDAGIGPGAGPQYGSMVHFAFASAVRLQDLPGIGALGVEQSFDSQGVQDYGKDGTIRTDVVLRDGDGPRDPIIAVWDLKTGSATLRPQRVDQIRSTLGIGTDVPILELHIQRGVNSKALPSPQMTIISLRLWKR